MGVLWKAIFGDGSHLLNVAAASVPLEIRHVEDFAADGVLPDAISDLWR
jgi:hypothetical protein